MTLIIIGMCVPIVIKFLLRGSIMPVVIQMASAMDVAHPTPTQLPDTIFTMMYTNPMKHIIGTHAPNAAAESTRLSIIHIATTLQESAVNAVSLIPI